MSSTGRLDESRSALGRFLREAATASWSAHTWRDTTHLMSGAVVGTVTATVVLSLAAITATLAVTVVLALPTLLALLWCNRWFTRWQRSRFAAWGEPAAVAAVAGWQGAGPTARLWAELRSRRTWRRLGFHTLAGFICPVGAVLVTACWIGGLLLLTIVVQSWWFGRSVMFGLDLHAPLTMVGLTLLGLVLLAAAPWVTRGTVGLELVAARSLLARTPSERLVMLNQRVRELTRSRAGMVDAADAERRRIERDLHDGTQQRLVSLAMRLGMTRATLGDAPEPVRQAVAEAHEEAKEALTELRDFVRGLHPAVLDDLGLDAALSGVAARCPVSVMLRVGLPHRPSRTIEAVAYFVVAEALTNVAKHAYATQVEVRVEHDPQTEVVRLVIADDGAGGATVSRGSGLRGLDQRIGSVDGTLRIDSPTGGPTQLVVELPCGS